jgi:hypothetical protein
LLYLANGRLFVRGDEGEIVEAKPWERGRETLLLAAQLEGMVDPVLGIDLPPSDN